VNKRNFLRALGFSVILWAIGVFAVNNVTMASCIPETGFAGVLHKALFAPTPACSVVAVGSKKCASAGASCNLNTSLSPGNGTQGVCTQTISGCACLTTATH
jgi:hypothetical protein